jgi:hypothetical protein
VEDDERTLEAGYRAVAILAAERIRTYAGNHGIPTWPFSSGFTDLLRDELIWAQQHVRAGLIAADQTELAEIKDDVGEALSDAISNGEGHIYVEDLVTELRARDLAVVRQIPQAKVLSLLQENRALRERLAHINNAARHELSRAIEAASDSFFKAAAWPKDGQVESGEEH